MPEGLRAAGWLVERHDDHFAQDTPDAVLLPAVASRGWVFVTEDRRIRRRTAERRALIESGLRTFSVSSSANLSAGATLAVLLRAKVAIDEVLVDTPGPFVFSIHRDGSLHALELGGS